MKVDVSEGVEQFLGFPAILGGVLHLQVFALAPAQLLQVAVQHGRQPVHQRLRADNTGHHGGDDDDEDDDDNDDDL